MTRTHLAIAFFCAVVVFGLGMAGAETVNADVATETSAQIERGRYLVHNASMCVQCHSPRDRFGELKTNRLLSGGAVPVKSPFAGPRWAFMAPNLRNLPGYSKEDFLLLMETGRKMDGTMPRLPMPPFRFSTEDAEAIYAYLKTQ
ncbi:MAG: cytochrome c [Acidobacteriota bacterium]